MNYPPFLEATFHLPIPTNQTPVQEYALDLSTSARTARLDTSSSSTVTKTTSTSLNSCPSEKNTRSNENAWSLRNSPAEISQTADGDNSCCVKCTNDIVSVTLEDSDSSTSILGSKCDDNSYTKSTNNTTGLKQNGDSSTVTIDLDLASKNDVGCRHTGSEIASFKVPLPPCPKNVSKNDTRNVSTAGQISDRTPRHTDRSISDTVRHTDRSISDTARHADLLISDTARHADHSISDTVRHVDRSISDTARHVDRSISDTARHVDHSISDSTRHVDHSISDTARHVDHSISDTARHVDHSISVLTRHVDHSISDSTRHADHSISDSTRHADHSISDIARHADHSISDTARRTDHSTSDTARHADHLISDTAVSTTKTSVSSLNSTNADSAENTLDKQVHRLGNRTNEAYLTQQKGNTCNTVGAVEVHESTTNQVSHNDKNSSETNRIQQGSEDCNKKTSERLNFFNPEVPSINPWTKLAEKYRFTRRGRLIRPAPIRVIYEKPFVHNYRLPSSTPDKEKVPESLISVGRKHSAFTPIFRRPIHSSTSHKANKVSERVRSEQASDYARSVQVSDYDRPRQASDHILSGQVSEYDRSEQDSKYTYAASIQASDRDRSGQASDYVRSALVSAQDRSMQVSDEVRFRKTSQNVRQVPSISYWPRTTHHQISPSSSSFLGEAYRYFKYMENLTKANCENLYTAPLSTYCETLPVHIRYNNSKDSNPNHTSTSSTTLSTDVSHRGSQSIADESPYLQIYRAVNQQDKEKKNPRITACVPDWLKISSTSCTPSNIDKRTLQSRPENNVRVRTFHSSAESHQSPDFVAFTTRLESNLSMSEKKVQAMSSTETGTAIGSTTSSALNVGGSSCTTAQKQPSLKILFKKQNWNSLAPAMSFSKGNPHKASLLHSASNAPENRRSEIVAATPKFYTYPEKSRMPVDQSQVLSESDGNKHSLRTPLSNQSNLSGNRVLQRLPEQPAMRTHQSQTSPQPGENSATPITQDFSSETPSQCKQSAHQPNVSRGEATVDKNKSICSVHANQSATAQTSECHSVGSLGNKPQKETHTHHNYGNRRHGVHSDKNVMRQMYFETEKETLAADNILERRNRAKRKLDQLFGSQSTSQQNHNVKYPLREIKNDPKDFQDTCAVVESAAAKKVSLHQRAHPSQTSKESPTAASLNERARGLSSNSGDKVSNNKNSASASREIDTLMHGSSIITKDQSPLRHTDSSSQMGQKLNKEGPEIIAKKAKDSVMANAQTPSQTFLSSANQSEQHTCDGTLITTNSPSLKNDAAKSQKKPLDPPSYCHKRKKTAIANSYDVSSSNEEVEIAKRKEIPITTKQNGHEIREIKESSVLSEDSFNIVCSNKDNHTQPEQTRLWYRLPSETLQTSTSQSEKYETIANTCKHDQFANGTTPSTALDTTPVDAGGSSQKASNEESTNDGNGSKKCKGVSEGTQTTFSFNIKDEIEVEDVSETQSQTQSDSNKNNENNILLQTIQNDNACSLKIVSVCSLQSDEDNTIRPTFSPSPTNTDFEYLPPRPIGSEMSPKVDGTRPVVMIKRENPHFLNCDESFSTGYGFGTDSSPKNSYDDVRVNESNNRSSGFCIKQKTNELSNKSGPITLADHEDKYQPMSVLEYGAINEHCAFTTQDSNDSNKPGAVDTVDNNSGKSNSSRLAQLLQNCSLDPKIEGLVKETIQNGTEDRKQSCDDVIKEKNAFPENDGSLPPHSFRSKRKRSPVCRKSVSYFSSASNESTATNRCSLHRPGPRNSQMKQILSDGMNEISPFQKTSNKSSDKNDKFSNLMKPATTILIEMDIAVEPASAKDSCSPTKDYRLSRQKRLEQKDSANLNDKVCRNSSSSKRKKQMHTASQPRFSQEEREFFRKKRRVSETNDCKHDGNNCTKSTEHFFSASLHSDKETKTLFENNIESHPKLNPSCVGPEDVGKSIHLQPERSSSGNSYDIAGRSKQPMALSVPTKMNITGITAGWPSCEDCDAVFCSVLGLKKHQRLCSKNKLVPRPSDNTECSPRQTTSVGNEKMSGSMKFLYGDLHFAFCPKNTVGEEGKCECSKCSLCFKKFQSKFKLFIHQKIGCYGGSLKSHCAYREATPNIVGTLYASNRLDHAKTLTSTSPSNVNSCCKCSSCPYVVGLDGSIHLLHSKPCSRQLRSQDGVKSNDKEHPAKGVVQTHPVLFSHDSSNPSMESTNVVKNTQRHEASTTSTKTTETSHDPDNIHKDTSQIKPQDLDFGFCSTSSHHSAQSDSSRSNSATHPNVKSVPSSMPGHAEKQRETMSVKCKTEQPNCQPESSMLDTPYYIAALNSKKELQTRLDGQNPNMTTSTEPNTQTVSALHFSPRPQTFVPFEKKRGTTAVSYVYEFGSNTMPIPVGNTTIRQQDENRNSIPYKTPHHFSTFICPKDQEQKDMALNKNSLGENNRVSDKQISVSGLSNVGLPSSHQSWEKKNNSKIKQVLPEDSYERLNAFCARMMTQTQSKRSASGPLTTPKSKPNQPTHSFSDSNVTTKTKKIYRHGSILDNGYKIQTSKASTCQNSASSHIPNQQQTSSLTPFPRSTCLLPELPVSSKSKTPLPRNVTTFIRNRHILPKPSTTSTVTSCTSTHTDSSSGSLCISREDVNNCPDSLSKSISRTVRIRENISKELLSQISKSRSTSGRHLLPFSKRMVAETKAGTFPFRTVDLPRLRHALSAEDCDLSSVLEKLSRSAQSNDQDLFAELSHHEK